jgi:uncharacterized protein YutE (UPF0331/DUF86 family)
LYSQLENLSNSSGFFKTLLENELDSILDSLDIIPKQHVKCLTSIEQLINNQSKIALKKAIILKQIFLYKYVCVSPETIAEGIMENYNPIITAIKKNLGLK